MIVNVTGTWTNFHGGVFGWGGGSEKQLHRRSDLVHDMDYSVNSDVPGHLSCSFFACMPSTSHDFQALISTVPGPFYGNAFAAPVELLGHGWLVQKG